MKRTDITDIFPEATEDQIKKLMDLNGSDINSARKGLDDLRAQLSTANSTIESLKQTPAEDLKAANDKAAALETELTALKTANQLRELRETVAKDTGVPASLLTGETAEACKTQAEAILAFAKPSGYPQVRDAGEVGNLGGATTRDKFASWAEENL